MRKLRAGKDLSILDRAGYRPTQRRVSAQAIEDYRSGIKSGKPFWNGPDYALDPIETSPSGAIKDGHHRLAAMLLEGIDPASLPTGTIRAVPEDHIPYPPRPTAKIRHK